MLTKLKEYVLGLFGKGRKDEDVLELIREQEILVAAEFIQPVEEKPTKKPRKPRKAKTTTE